MTTNTTIAVVVVNWNSGQLLEACVNSLRAQSLKCDRIVVVDNGSTDSSIDFLAPAAADLELIRLSRNVGFAAANNVAIRRLEGYDWVALLNPDAIANRDWLERLITAAVDHPEFATFASRMLDAQDARFLDGAGDGYHFSGLVRRRGYQLPANGRYCERQEVFSPCAGAALYRRDALLAAGGFDESYFCYVEDVDLGFRLQLLGYRCLYVPSAVVHHLGSATTGLRSEFYIYHGQRNLIWTFVKNMPGVLLWLFLLPHILINLAAVIYYFMKGQARPVLRAKRDALQGLPRVWSQRRDVQQNRVVSLSAMLRMLSFGWPRAGRFWRD